MPTFANNRLERMDDATASSFLYAIAMHIVDYGEVTIETGTAQSQAIIYAMTKLKETDNV